jgi:lipopolysaccharide transport system ATP-binding protein
MPVSDVVIRAEGLGKKYLIGHKTKPERYTALRDVIGRSARSLLRTARDTLQGRQLVAGDEVEEFWALKDVSFEVRRGEVLGIIGRNGAGKSTLLKVLSRITEPSAGRVEIRGRIASLLEVGTGFHQELTGRENIYLNGSVLGMTRAEIARKFDEIVAFAEVERFLDTPVKHYSSGMHVRLAFAVAAQLEPEILVIDEVLAVGDADFQAKCLGKMHDVAGGQGRTVLFVSHSMAAVSSICDRGVILDAGRLVFRGTSSDAVAEYLSRLDAAGGAMAWEGPAPAGDASVQAVRARLVSAAQRLVTHEPIRVELELQVREPVRDLIVAWELWSASDGLLAYTAMDDALPPPGVTTAPGLYRLVLEIPPDTLAAGSYRLCLDLGIHNVRRIVPEKSVALRLEIDNVGGIARRYPGLGNVLRPSWKWLVTSNVRRHETVA